MVSKLRGLRRRTKVARGGEGHQPCSRQSSLDCDKIVTTVRLSLPDHSIFGTRITHIPFCNHGPRKERRSRPTRTRTSAAATARAAAGTGHAGDPERDPAAYATGLRRTPSGIGVRRGRRSDVNYPSFRAIAIDRSAFLAPSALRTTRPAFPVLGRCSSPGRGDCRSSPTRTPAVR